MWLVHHALCLFTPQLLTVLTKPTQGGMARLSWPGWLVTYWRWFSRLPTVTHPSTNRARRWLTWLIIKAKLPPSDKITYSLLHTLFDSMIKDATGFLWLLQTSSHYDKLFNVHHLITYTYNTDCIILTIIIHDSTKGAEINDWLINWLIVKNWFIFNRLQLWHNFWHYDISNISNLHILLWRFVLMYCLHSVSLQSWADYQFDCTLYKQHHCHFSNFALVYER